MTDLFAELSVFNGKQTDVLEALAQRCDPSASVVRQLCVIAASDDPRLQVGATWLLKRFADDGAAFTPAQAGRLLGLLPAVSYWEARLHLLQMLPGVPIPEIKATELHRRLASWLDDDNKLIRAWAYNGLAELANQRPQFREDVAGLLVAVPDDEAAAVKARVRNILKSSKWAQPAKSRDTPSLPTPDSRPQTPCETSSPRRA